MTRSIIIDTDPGQDDAVAMLLALGSPELDVLGVTAVAGNVPLVRTESNARRVLEVAGRTDVPVFAGCARPMVRRLFTAEHVHGVSGLDGADLPEPTMPLQPRHAVDFLVETLMERPERSVTLCALGPLTNIAMAMVKEPRIVPRIREIVLMGGGFFEGGNVTPAAEFNIFVDPHAAHVVFESGAPIAMFPLDVTHKALTTKARIAKMRAAGTPAAKSVAGMLEFFARHDSEKYGVDGAPLHDPMVIAWLLKPELFDGRACNVRIEMNSETSMGMTLVDWWRVTGLPVNAQVMREVDADGCFDLIAERLARL